MGTRVILLRHGQSTYNALGLYQGCCDESMLTETGYRTAEQTSAFLSGVKLDAIYTSPLQRAQETARQVLATLECVVNPEQIDVVPLLRETDLPAWQGRPFQSVREQFASDYRSWKQTPDQFSMEVLQAGVKQLFYPALDLYARLQQFWREVLPRHRNQTLLIVAHGGTNRAAIATALGIPPSHYHAIQQSNCALNILHFPNGELNSAQLEGVNLATHIGENLPQPKEGGQGLRLLLVPAQAVPKTNQQLTALLKAVPIHFSLSQEQDDIQQTLDTIVDSHPETVRLQVLHQDFPEIWRQALAQTKLIQTQPNTPLTTGLFVADPNVIASFLGQTIGLEESQNWRLQLQPSTLSVIHYPATDHPPILQIMNASGVIEQQLSEEPIVTPRKLVQI